MNGDAAFTLTDDTGLLLTCALDTSGSFASESPEDDMDLTKDSADVYLMRLLTYSGVFETPTSRSLSSEQASSCEGADCGRFEKREGTTLPSTSWSEPSPALRHLVPHPDQQRPPRRANHQLPPGTAPLCG